MNINQLFLPEGYLIDQGVWISNMIPIIQINRVNWDLNKMSKHLTKHNSLNNRNFHQEEEIGEFKKILSKNQSNNQFSNQSNNQFNKQFNNLNKMNLQIIGG